MTNAEVFEMLFNLKVDRSTCPVDNCDNCPANNGGPACTYSFWNDEFKGESHAVKIEITEHGKIEERPQGKWQENENGTGFCSKCNDGIYYRTPTGRVYMMLKEQIVKFGYKYCPNCGADMRGKEE